MEKSYKTLKMSLVLRHWCYVTGVTVCPLVLNMVKNAMWTYCLFVCSDPKLASYTLLLANASLMKFEVSLSCLSGP